MSISICSSFKIKIETLCWTHILNPCHSKCMNLVFIAFIYDVQWEKRLLIISLGFEYISFIRMMLFNRIDSSIRSAGSLSIIQRNSKMFWLSIHLLIGKNVPRLSTNKSDYHSVSFDIFLRILCADAYFWWHICPSFIKFLLVKLSYPIFPAISCVYCYDFHSNDWFWQRQKVENRLWKGQ